MVRMQEEVTGARKGPNKDLGDIGTIKSVVSSHLGRVLGFYIKTARTRRNERQARFLDLPLAQQKVGSSTALGLLVRITHKAQWAFWFVRG